MAFAFSGPPGVPPASGVEWIDGTAGAVLRARNRSTFSHDSFWVPAHLLWTRPFRVPCRHLCRIDRLLFPPHWGTLITIAFDWQRSSSLLYSSCLYNMAVVQKLLFFARMYSRIVQEILDLYEYLFAANAAYAGERLSIFDGLLGLDRTERRDPLAAARRSNQASRASCWTVEPARFWHRHYSRPDCPEPERYRRGSGAAEVCAVPGLVVRACIRFAAQAPLRPTDHLPRTGCHAACSHSSCSTCSVSQGVHRRGSESNRGVHLFNHLELCILYYTLCFSNSFIFLSEYTMLSFASRSPLRCALQTARSRMTAASWWSSPCALSGRRSFRRLLLSSKLTLVACSSSVSALRVMLPPLFLVCRYLLHHKEAVSALSLNSLIEFLSI